MEVAPYPHSLSTYDEAIEALDNTSIYMNLIEKEFLTLTQEDDMNQQQQQQQKRHDGEEQEKEDDNNADKHQITLATFRYNWRNHVTTT
ncbi:hypothetical protein JTB14_016553 [Gonioctena quinquepunctata]|nr:hypothetical protein JTB14_016553 [Gonioctena quinquepunctata]